MTALRATFALAALATTAVAFGFTADAQAGRGGKEVFVQDYSLSKPLHGYSGHTGAYYCDYQRLPQRKCIVVGGAEKCKIVGWTLREMCH